MKKHLNALVFILLILISIKGLPQSKIPSSPEATSLSKMVNYPVSYNTGIPSISIPLYTIESGGMSLPIVLNYHSGGFKIHERATSVGLGWSLSSDLQITRTINGLDDFLPQGYINNSKMKSYSNNCSSCDYPLFNSTLPFPSYEAYNIAAGLVDGMPDKFNYKLLNKSGSFYFRKNSSGTGYRIVPVPYDNLNITFKNGEFTIIDTDGTKYNFGGQGPLSTANLAANATELSGANLNRSAWKCTTIQNATKTETITFSYQAKAGITFRSKTQSIEYFNNSSPCMDRYFTGETVFQGTPTYENLLQFWPFYYLSSPKWIENFSFRNSVLHLPYLNSTNQVVDKTYPFNDPGAAGSQMVYGLALSSINFKGGSVVFNGTDKINSIQVRNAANEEVKTFTLFQSYAVPNNLSLAQNCNGSNFLGTPYLDSVQFKVNNVAYETYKLMYKTKYCFGSHLQGKDAWGYPNYLTKEGSSWDDFLDIPQQNVVQRFYKDLCRKVVEDVTFTFGNNSANAENPDIGFLSSGILKRIVYPTGGYVDFNFESNMIREKLNDRVDKVVMTGGLRIRSISQFDGKSVLPVSQKYFRYGDLEDGIGQLINSPAKTFNPLKNGYDAYSYTQSIGYLIGPGSINAGTNFTPVPVGCSDRSCLRFGIKEEKTTYLPASSIDYTYPNGAPIYYTKVTEYNQDLGTISGKKVYEYHSPNYFGAYNFSTQSKVSGTNIDILQTDGLMGEQKSVKEYKYNKGIYSLLHSREFRYEKYSEDEQIRVVYSIFKTKYQVVGGNFRGSDMDLYNTTYSFASGSLSEGWENYNVGEYGIQVAKLLLSQEIEKWVKGKEVVSKVTNFVYNNSRLQPSMITVSGSGASSDVSKSIRYAYDFPDNVYTQMVANNRISDVIEEVSFTGGKEISRKKTNYGLVNNSAFIVPVSVQSSNAGGVMDTVLTYDLYDGYANLLQVRENMKKLTSYVWGYGYKYPVVKADGASYAKVTSGVNVDALQALTNEFQIKSVINSIRTSVPEAMVNTFTYKPLLGLSTETAANGTSKYYEYDKYGRLSIIKDNNLNIIKKYDYKYSNATLGSQSNYSVNVPIMLTFSDLCPDDNKLRVTNVIQPGGSFTNNSSSAADGDARANLNSKWRTLSKPVNCEAPVASVPIKIKVEIWTSTNRPRPTGVYCDFIKDNSIVATQRFPDNNGQFSEFNIEPNSYTLGLRYDENYNGSICFVEIVVSDGTYYSIKSGDLFEFKANERYSITLSNAYYF